MAKKASANGTSQRYAYMKQRIAKMQGKAKALGLLYLLATIALTALACLPLLVLNDETIGVNLGVMEFWTVFTSLGEGIQGKELTLAVAVIYGLLLLTLAINLLRSVCKLGWLFKKRASRLYGFNRNMYAMDDMGRRFSSSFAAILASHVVIALLVASVTLQPMAYAVLGVGAFFHFACGIPAGNVSLFNTDNGVVEERRELGSFSPFVRNVFQILIVAAATYLFLGVSQIRATVELLLAENGFAELTGDFTSLIIPVLHVVMLLILVGMIYYATGTIEFDSEGAEASGRKRFLALSVLLLLCAGGAFAYEQFVAQTTVHQNAILLAVVALIAVIIELVLIGCPKVKTENPDEVEVGAYLSESYDKPGVYLSPAASNAYEMNAYAQADKRNRLK